MGRQSLSLSGLECRHALDTGVSWKCCHWSVDDCLVAGIAARITPHICQVRSWNFLGWDSRLGPRLDVRSILEIRRDWRSTSDLWAWLWSRILVSQQAITCLVSHSLAGKKLFSKCFKLTIET